MTTTEIYETEIKARPPRVYSCRQEATDALNRTANGGLYYYRLGMFDLAAHYFQWAWSIALDLEHAEFVRVCTAELFIAG